jgi:hypothetical protein
MKPADPTMNDETMAAKFQQLVERVTRLEEMIMGAVVHASDHPDPPAPPPPPANR